MLTFLRIRAVHERYGDGPTRAALLHTIARQEQDAAVEGVTTFGWLTIVLAERGEQSLHTHGRSRSSLLASLHELHGAPQRAAGGGRL